MAIAATPISRNKGLLDLLRQTIPLQERAVDFYRRLLAINNLAASMNSAKELDQLQDYLASYFQEYLYEDSIRLCIVEDNKYKKSYLAGPQIRRTEEIFPLDHGIVGKALKSGKPLWIPDVHSEKKIAGWDRNSADNSLRSIIVFPFSALGKVIGCIEMTSNQKNRFDEVEYHLGFLVAAHLSSSLQNVLTKRELAAANARLRRFADLSFGQQGIHCLLNRLSTCPWLSFWPSGPGWPVFRRRSSPCSRR